MKIAESRIAKPVSRPEPTAPESTGPELRTFDSAAPPSLDPDAVQDERGRPAIKLVLKWALEQSRQQRRTPLLVQMTQSATGRKQIVADDLNCNRYWAELTDGSIDDGLARIQQQVGTPVTVFPHGELVGKLRGATSQPDIAFAWAAYPALLSLDRITSQPSIAATPHLRRLEMESIHIIREAVAEADNPVMLYSIGKDSAVMLHLARKAFYPSVPPFPLLHVDTRWKFQEMYLFRDYMAQISGMELLVHINPEAVERDINPFDHGSALHTEITKTEGLKQALDQNRFDVVFGGARRDEEKSRAKERIFSFRTQTHRWDPKNQRPELWNLYNAKKNRGESIRVFPLSNWTELDVWQYIYQENIPIVPLYFAKPRPVVVRNGLILSVDDDRFRMLPNENIVEKLVRFRTLGCYPLTGAIESAATTLPEIIVELLNARNSERQGRAIDSDSAASMEKKKQEGYF